MSVTLSSYAQAVAAHLTTESATPSIEQFEQRNKVIEAWLTFVNRAQGLLNAYQTLNKIIEVKIDILDVQSLSPQQRIDNLAYRIGLLNQIKILEVLEKTEAKPVAKL